MEQTNLLGTSFNCKCGKKHIVPTKHLFYEDNAFDSLLDTARSITDGSHYLILADTRTFEAAGRIVEEKLKIGAAGVSHFIIPDNDGESPAADSRTKDLILDQAPPADLYIAVGSGVINDLVKWIAFLRDKPYITVATAASMNGYASANVAATIDGLKVLFHANACQAVFAVPEIIINAPFELTSSGETLWLLDSDMKIVDTVTFPMLKKDKSFGCVADSCIAREQLAVPSPGRSNLINIDLHVPADGCAAIEPAARGSPLGNSKLGQLSYFAKEKRGVTDVAVECRTTGAMAVGAR